MERKNEIIGKLARVIIIIKLTSNGVKYQVIGKITVEVTQEEDKSKEIFRLNLINIETGEKKKYNLETADVWAVIEKMVETEQETGNKQLLIINTDKGRWDLHSMDEKWMEEFPEIKKVLDKIDETKYIT
jgi:hypothetical protein